MSDKRALYEVIADKLELAILSDPKQFKHGFLSENQLCSVYGVSRPVVREALKILKARGLIEGRQGASTTVKSYGVDDFKKSLSLITATHGATSRDVYEVRIALELTSVRLATRNLTEENREELISIVGKMRSTKNEDVHAHAVLDTEFHVAVAKATKNPLLAFTTQAFAEQLEKVIEESMGKIQDEEGVLAHEELLKAILDGDEDTAVTVMQSHLIQSMQKHLNYNK